MTRRLAAGVAFAAGALMCAGSGSAKPLALIGIEQDGARPVSLWSYDPDTLQRFGGNLPLAGHGRAWSFSPDPNRAQVVLASSWRSTLARPTSLRFLEMNHTSMRVRGDLRLRGELASVRATAWVRPNRLLVLLQGNPYESAVVAVDTRRLELVGRRKLAPGLALLGGGRTSSGFALLLAKREAIGPATLATVDADLRVRSVRLGEILAGSKHRQVGSVVEGTARHPGVAVDAPGGRAFVVAEGQLAAEIELATMRVRYHRVATRLSQARTKTIDGTWLRAEWLGKGLLAVAGWNYSRERRDAVPTGLRVIDTRSWTERLIHEAAGFFHVVGRTLAVRAKGGLSGFDFDGTRRFELPGESGWVQSAGGRLYVGARGNRSAAIVDAATGTMVGSYRGEIPRLLGDAEQF